MSISFELSVCVKLQNAVINLNFIIIKLMSSQYIFFFSHVLIRSRILRENGKFITKQVYKLVFLLILINKVFLAYEILFFSYGDLNFFANFQLVKLSSLKRKKIPSLLLWSRNPWQQFQNKHLFKDGLRYSILLSHLHHNKISG